LPLRRSLSAMAPCAAAVLMLTAFSTPTVDQLTEYSALRAFIVSSQPYEILDSGDAMPALLGDSFTRRRNAVDGVLAAAGETGTEQAPRLLLASYGDFGSFLQKPTLAVEPSNQSESRAPTVNRLNKQDRMVSSRGILTQMRADPRTGRIMKVTRLVNLNNYAPSVADGPAQTPAAKSRQNDESVNHASAEGAKRDLQCLAKAVYFEARGEPEAGQLAVAQVVMNRVKHWFYPDDVCAVVFQNESRRNKCQFSFACDGRADQPLNKEAWERAVRLAKKVLYGQARSAEVGDSTHYHADYVSPKWVRDMIKVRTIGTHVFYKVRNWS
jgi:spore germination cell wall hydrolase CwlJ-like protein